MIPVRLEFIVTLATSTLEGINRVGAERDDEAFTGLHTRLIKSYFQWLGLYVGVET